MKSLLLSPHADDAELFAAFTIQRETPHVILVTDSWIQFNRGSGVTSDDRWNEAVAASEVLKYPILRLGLRDDTLTEEELEKSLEKYVGVFNRVYVPMLQHGNKDHDMVHNVAKKLFGDTVIEYATYTKNCLWTVGNVEVVPTKEELALKNEALMCHQSQWQLNRPHFEAIFGKSEWLNDPSKPLYQNA